MKFLRLISIQNLLLLALAMLVFRYGFLEQLPDVYLSLSNMQYFLLVLSAVCIAAGGFVIDGISNSKKAYYGVSEEKGINLYMALTIIGVGIGFYLANYIEKPWFSVLFIVVAGGLYLYATSLRHSLIISNLVVAIMIALAFIVPAIFNLYPVVALGNVAALPSVFKEVLNFSLLVFIAGLLHSIVKDIRDTDTDYNSGYNTLPVALGKSRAAKIALGVAVVLIGASLYFFNFYLIQLPVALGFGLLTVVGPLIYCCIKIFSATGFKDFSRLEFILRLVLFFVTALITAKTINTLYA